MLFDRRLVVKVIYDEKSRIKTFYVRHPETHKWEEDGYLCTRYLYGNLDGVEEVIDYDEKTEEITSVRRDPGSWVNKEYYESFTPSKQVADYIAKTGVRYEDLFCPAQQRDDPDYDILDALKDFDDLTAGLPKAGDTAGKKRRRRKTSK